MKLRRTDILFSQFIRSRDNWTCQRCHKYYEPPTQALHCSHYWGRAREATRFEPDNCISLCFGCHLLWGHGDLRDEYKTFMFIRLGEKRFKMLMVQAHQYKKKDDKMNLIIIKELLKSLSI